MVFTPLKLRIPPNLTNAAMMKQQQNMVMASFVHFNLMQPMLSDTSEKASPSYLSYVEPVSKRNY
jgi:hypothetical protein